MLVLSRQRDETIMIGDDIEITVVDIRGDKIRLGIEAPANVAVHRKEVYEAIRRENEQASRMDVSDYDEFRITPTPTNRKKGGLKRGSGQTRARIRSPQPKPARKRADQRERKNRTA